MCPFEWRMWASVRRLLLIWVTPTATVSIRTLTSRNQLVRLFRENTVRLSRFNDSARGLLLRGVRCAEEKISSHLDEDHQIWAANYVHSRRMRWRPYTKSYHLWLNPLRALYSLPHGVCAHMSTRTVVSHVHNCHSRRELFYALNRTRSELNYIYVPSSNFCFIFEKSIALADSHEIINRTRKIISDSI